MKQDPAWSRVMGRPVYLRPGTSDAQVAADTIGGAGGYHRPPKGFVPKTVLDCGANIGLASADYQRMWPEAHIVAVEPDEGNAGVAAANFGGEVVIAAVSTLSGWLSLQRDGLAQEAYRLERGGSEEKVRCRTLKQLIEVSFDNGTCDFVKLDIEGEEAVVLRKWKPWAGLVRAVLVECHEQITGYTWRDATKDLSAAGFEVERHTIHPQAVWAVKA